MKPLKRKNYGSIGHLLGSKLGKTDKYVAEGQHNILTKKVRDKNDVVFVTEKYDGSNVGIARVDGKIVAITRKGNLASKSPFHQHNVFAKWVSAYEDRFWFIEEGERLAGEWLYQIHSIEYNIPLKLAPFIAFDYFTADNKRISYFDLMDLTSAHKIPMVRVLNIGGAIPIENAFHRLFSNQSQFGITTKSELPEGIVYRVERSGIFDFCAKFVRKDFEPGKACINVDENDLKYNECMF